MIPRRILTLVVITGLVFLAGSSAARGAIIEIGPFTGDLTETWEGFPTSAPEGDILPDPTAIMSGQAMISHPVMQIFQPWEVSHSLGSSGYAQPSDGIKALRVNGFNQSASISFEVPIRQFGAYWGAFTDPDITGDPAVFSISFFDDVDQLIDTLTFTYSRPFDGVLEWHGWRSDVDIYRFNFHEDAIAIDGLQASLIPEPNSQMIYATAIALTSTFRIRRKKAGCPTITGGNSGQPPIV